MKFSAAIATLATAGSALAAPSAPPTFDIMAIRPSSEFHFSKFSAAQGSLFLGLKEEGAKCKGDNNNKATFYFKNKSLYLYNADGKTQKVFVDRSGMGQGKIGYMSGEGNVPPHFEMEGWHIDENKNLSFGGKGLLACPHATQDAWSVWLVTDNATPGGNKDCLGLTAAMTVPTVGEPVSCEYSQ